MTFDATQSLRKRLLAAVLAAVVAVGLLLALVIHGAVTRTTGQILDHKLTRQARVILAYAEHEFAETGAVVPEPVADPGRSLQPEVMYQIWRKNGTLIYRSQGAPGVPLLSPSGSGIRDVAFNGTGWRACALQSDAMPIQIEIAEPLAERQLVIDQIRHAVGLPVALSLPVLGLLVWWLTTAALRPMGALERDIASRSATCMTALNLRGMPTEIIALGKALNALIARQAEALEREHRFTADAAHELRTPMAAIRAQAQVALRATASRERAHALEQLLIGVDRSSRLITQLLALARLEPEPVMRQIPTRAVSQILQDVLHDLAGELDRSHVSVVVKGTAQELVSEEPLYLMLRNLIENALHHSPVNGTIEVAMSQDQGSFVVSVQDHGPGIPPELREAALDRFRRFSTSYNGTGLGLSIVKRAVDRLGGSLSLCDTCPGPGLNAVVAFRLAG